jgi:ATP-dependent helicase HrpB
MLEGVGCVILDEFHERSIHTDLAIALLREIQQSVRPDLLIVVMSATLAAEPVSQFLGSCPIIESPGRLFPVEIEHVIPRGGDRLPERVAVAVEDSLATGRDAGDLLVFLPGSNEIRWTYENLASLADRFKLDLIPLHGSLPFEQQLRALRPSDRCKIILSTNIAETSLTIDGVRTVIDSGLARVPWYDPQRGLDRLELKRISKASAVQRAGRAGRTAPGRCVRLWTAKEHHELDDFELPEVRRVDLCGTILTLHAWGQPDARKFGWFERPPADAIESAERLLEMLGALDSESNGKITQIGKKLMSMPVHPRLGRLMLEAVEAGRAEEGATLAAILSEKDFAPDDLPPRIGDSDLVVRMELLSKSRSAVAQQILRVRDELLRGATTVAWASRPRNKRSEGEAPTPQDEDICKWALLAYPDRVARRRGSDPSSAVMVGGGGLKLARESVVKRAEFFVAVDARQDQRSNAREALVRIASAIEPQWLEQLFPQSIRQDRELVFDEQRQRVVARGTTWYRDLLLVEDKDAPVDPERAGTVLGNALRLRGREILEWDESAASVLRRVAFVRHWIPEQPWPTFDDAQLGELVAEASRAKRSVEELRRNSLASVLLGQLAYPLDRKLEELAPERIEVPSGSRVAIDYSNPAKPAIAVRLQELFGWTQTPRLAGGRAPVVLHLLGPNFRPVQITEDLHSFWTNTYAQVRKDLRTRYPKHAWPENPFDAKAEAKGGRKR